MCSFLNPTVLHQAVLLDEVIAFFADRQLEYFIDGTLGLGGHSEALLRGHPELACLMGVDRDPMALAYAKLRLAPWEAKVKLIRSNFADIGKTALAADGILLDLGVSSLQLDTAERGFSFMRDGPLDMRMGEGELQASIIVNEWSAEEMMRLFWKYGEEPQGRKAARLIVANRPFKTTLQLAEALKPLGRSGKKHPATLVFQALRIAVNGELDALEAVLPLAIDLLRSGGRLGIISFHSLEDRMVKQFFREAASDKVSDSGICGVFLDKKPTVRLVTRKAVVATDEEMARNPRSRSAKLRVVEKL